MRDMARKSFRLGRLVREGGRWWWFGPCHNYTRRGHRVVRLPRENW
jgi:hypothetical protein